MLEAEKSRPIRKWWRLVGANINHVWFSILLDLRLKSAFFTTLGALSLLRRAWSMAGSTIKFTLEISSGDYLYFAVCILCFVSCILHFERCILYFVLFLYSTPSSSPLSSPRWMIGSSPRRQTRRRRRRPTTISAFRLLSSSWSPSPDPSWSVRGWGRRYFKIVVTFSTLESIWEGVRGMLFLFLFDIFSENQAHWKISQIKVSFADTYPVLFSLYSLISCSCALGTAWPTPPGPLPVRWLCHAKKPWHIFNLYLFRPPFRFQTHPGLPFYFQSLSSQTSLEILLDDNVHLNLSNVHFPRPLVRGYQLFWYTHQFLSPFVEEVSLKPLVTLVLENLWV